MKKILGRPATALFVLGLFGALVACSGDDPQIDGSSSSGSSGAGSSGVGASSSSSGSADGGSSSGSSSGSASQSFDLQAATVYASDTAVLDATAEFDPDTAVTWTIAEKPAGSEAAVPSGTPAARPSFRPDLPGAYRLAASGVKNGAVREGSVRLTAAEAELVYLRVTAGDAGQAAGYAVRAAGSIAGAARDLSCAGQTAAVTSGEKVPLNYAHMGLAYHYGAPGEPVRVVFSALRLGQDAATSIGLAAVGSDGNCDAVRELVAPDGEELANAVFNADGSRIAYVRQAEPRVLSTIGYDGTGGRVVLTDNNLRYRPTWTPDGALSSLRTVDSDTWQIVTFADSAAAESSVFMNCEGTMGSAFAWLPEGRVLVVNTPPSGSLGIRVMHPGADPNKTCVVDRTLVEDGGSFPASLDGVFALSPSGTQLAFGGRSGGVMRLYLMPVDGSAAPRSLNSLVGAPEGDAGPDRAADMTSPVWLGTDALLAWSSGQGVTTVRTDGTPIAPGQASHAADSTADASSRFVTAGSFSSCSVGLGGTGSAGVFVLTLLALRRRRQRAA